MKHLRLIAVLAASSMLATFSAYAYDKDGDVMYDKDGDGKHHHKKHHHHPEHRFTLTGGATYLAPTMNGLDYTEIETTGLGGITDVSGENLSPGYDWGYFLAFGYMISDRYDIQASWQQYDSSDSESTTVTGPATMLTSSLDDTAVLAAGDVDTASTSETLKTQAFDATLGQYHKLNSTLMARPFVGVRYAKVQSDTTNTYTGTSPGVPATESYSSKYDGVGPEIGLDAEYEIVKHFGVIGHIAAAFLVGNLSTDTDVDNGSSFASYSNKDDTRVVPEMEAKLGLGWNSLYANDSFGIGIEGGYQVSYFFDVVDQVIVDTGSDVILHNYSDVGIMGPYLNVSAHF